MALFVGAAAAAVGAGLQIYGGLSKASAEESAGKAAARLGVEAAGLQAKGASFQGEANAFNAELEGENAARQYEAEAAADTFNAKVAKNLARNVRSVGRADAADYIRLQRARIATSRANFGKSNLALEGSPMLVDSATLAAAELGRIRIIVNAENQGTGLEDQAALLKVEAANAGQNAAIARQAGGLNARLARAAADINIKAANLNARSARLGAKTASAQATATRIAGFAGAANTIAGTVSSFR